VLVLLIPLGASSLQTLRYERWIGATESAAEQWVQGTGWQVESVKQASNGIVINAVGSGGSPPIRALKNAVRRSVPQRIEVKLIEGSGKTIGL
jgi:hypothetical protein